MRRRRHNLAQEAGQLAQRGDAPANAAYTDLHYALQSADLDTAPLCVVTGFGPFGSVAVNPSELLANKVCDLAAAAGLTIMSRILAVQPAAVDEFIAEMMVLRPRCIIALGVTADEAQFEHSAQNAIMADGETGLRPIDAKLELGASIPSDMSMNQVEVALAATRPHEPRRGDVQTFNSALARHAWFESDNTAYLCNYMNFRLAQAFTSDELVEAGFVHITQETPPEQIVGIFKAATDAR